MLYGHKSADPALTPVRLNIVGPLKPRRDYASLCCVPSWRKPDECKDGGAEALLRKHGRCRRYDSALECNVVFSARAKSEAAFARQAEAAMAKHLGRTFYTIVRPASVLRDLIETDPYATFHLPANAKRVVTFLREPSNAKLSLPLVTDGVRILAMNGREIFTAYVPNPRGPVFMTLIEKTFGINVTTRTWDTVKKCATA